MSGTITYGPDGNARSFDGLDAVDVFRIATLISSLKLEMKGMRMSRGMSALAVAKRFTGLKTNKREVQIAALEERLRIQRTMVTHITEEA